MMIRLTHNWSSGSTPRSLVRRLRLQMRSRWWHLYDRYFSLIFVQLEWIHVVYLFIQSMDLDLKMSQSCIILHVIVSGFKNKSCTHYTLKQTIYGTLDFIISSSHALRKKVELL